MIIVIAIINWTYVARIVRGQVLSLREKEFVEAARSLGASNGRILFREILPNLLAPLIVYSSLFIPANILLEAALSFLGVGVSRRHPVLGRDDLRRHRIFPEAWWFMLFPGLALLLTVLAFNLVGDGLQDALNPKPTVKRMRSRPAVHTHERTCPCLGLSGDLAGARRAGRRARRRRLRRRRRRRGRHRRHARAVRGVG